ncbi:hypothetical protein ACVBEH_13600 [Roseateles sp. GG27B]
MSSQHPEEDDDRTIIKPRSIDVARPSTDQATLISTAVPGLQSTAPTGPLTQPLSTAPSNAVSSAASSAGESGNALPLSTYLGEFELTGVIGEGGFGIVYLAWDHSLQRKVALKEYMPSALSNRVGTTQVQVKSERHRETFDLGLRSFINEARLLAQFDHPSWSRCTDSGRLTARPIW